jgi:hypothetical protein
MHLSLSLSLWRGRQLEAEAPRPALARGPLAVLAPVGAGLLLALWAPALASAEEACPNAAYRTGPSAALPDCRAYELVTPPRKNANYALESLVGPAAQSLIVSSETAMSTGAVGNGYLGTGSSYGLRRGAAGWESTPLNPPASEYEAVDVYRTGLAGVGFAGRETLWVEHGRTLPSNEADVYLEPSPGAPLQDIGAITPPGVPAGATPGSSLERAKVIVDGSSEDLSRVFFEVNFPDNSTGYYWPFDKTVTGASLYEYVGTNGALGSRAPMLVGVDSEGKQISQCGTQIGANGRTGHNAVSANGETVFFTAHSFEGCNGVPGEAPLVNEIYARVERSGGQHETIPISEPTSADCALCKTAEGLRQQAHFVAGSEDGATAVFETVQPLLGEDTSENLYEYDMRANAGSRVVRISSGDSTVSRPTADVRGVVQVSEDGAHVYFVAGGVLTTRPNEFGQVAQSGANNFYVFDIDTETTKFIATLSSEDSQLWNGRQHGADATPDGRFLAFTAATHITPDDTSAARQAFEYDAQTGELVRVSSGQRGYNSNGNAEQHEVRLIGADYEEYGKAGAIQYWTHLTMSENGSYLFFQSRNALTPQAHPGLPNVYEYRSTGRISAGEIGLISDGSEITQYTREGESSIFGGELLGTDASGEDVYVTSIDQLAPQDLDSQQDIYDARVDGGFPGSVASDECAGEECQGQLSAAPVLLSPGSEFQVGTTSVQAPVAATTRVVPKHKVTAKKKAKAKKRAGSKRKRGRSAGKNRRGAARRGN